MGGGGSKEAVLPLAPGGANGPSASSSAGSATSAYAPAGCPVDDAVNRAEAVANEAYRQGFSAAQDDILKHLDERVREQAEKEYARHVAEEETQRVAQVEKEAAALERKYARPPMRETECKVEEAALVSCKPGRANDECAREIRAYTACADQVLYRLMNPSAAATGKLR